ncbi:MAG: alanine racemase [Clostridiales bacterium]|nr:alanine racemase [Clostridiales bacterium]
MLRGNQVTIDLDAIANNYNILRGNVPASVRVMPVIKADAYGHGMIPVAQKLSSLGVRDFAIAIPEEGIALREAGVQGNILVLGAGIPRAVESAVAFDLTQTVFTADLIGLVNEEAKKQNKIASVHIKLDTGMNRIGIRTTKEAQAISYALASAPFVNATGLYTHFADADNPKPDGSMNDFTRCQLDKFNELKSCFPSKIPAHVANSAMSLVAPEAYFDMIREGISLYGYPPVYTKLSFKHALQWTTEIVSVKEVEAGETIGYGRSFTAPHQMKIATVAVGYGDGYHRMCSNRGMMLVGGQRAPIVGRVCMDQTMLDVTKIQNVQAWDEVVIIGKQGNDGIDAQELASWAETISYEVLLAITQRVPKIYLGNV